MRSFKSEIVIEGPQLSARVASCDCSYGCSEAARPLWMTRVSEQFYTDAGRLIVEPYRCRALSVPPLSARGPRPESISRLVMYAYA
jgi:hypothetical protein